MHFQAESRGENETKAKSLANHQSCQPHAMLTPKLLKGPSFLWRLDNNMMDNFPDDARHAESSKNLIAVEVIQFFEYQLVFLNMHNVETLELDYYLFSLTSVKVTL